MGHGEEGLARALAWGRRTVKARIYTSRKVPITFDFTKIQPANLSKSIAKATKSMPISVSTSPVGDTSLKVTTYTSAVVFAKPDELDIKLKSFESEKRRVQAIIEELGTPRIGDV